MLAFKKVATISPVQMPRPVRMWVAAWIKRLAEHQTGEQGANHFYSCESQTIIGRLRPPMRAAEWGYLLLLELVGM